jgi:MarR family 2-MHQ and catechol resistance regulon transcriptional repressor
LDARIWLGMKIKSPAGVHVWLVFIKAFQAIGKLAQANLEQSGLGDSDFRALEVLLHKSPLPVNVIGPKVGLTPGSISVAVDRLHARGLVSRIEDCDERRIRIVDLAPEGRALIEPVFPGTRHSWRRLSRFYRRKSGCSWKAC